MPRQCASVKSVEQFIGHAVSRPNGDNEKPYGKCYGQVCGQYYPELQREYVDPKKEALEERKAANRAAKKSAYEKAKRVAHNAKNVRCVETGEVYSSKREAAKSIGVGVDMLSRRIARGTEVNGLHFEEVR